ncbi:hypothetical protein MYG64_26265 (plasmid) [Ensifer adhaerens]|uniref:hypothetical protein n=1 Tax=Ensifer adhaerens TaxID=106592 RepID=UPI0021018E74|nr:hypothetical protein [Ensifer adhaerens]UTV39233.1 hypothetical protein MYG64_26265 [Ensifer adhaerens]
MNDDLRGDRYYLRDIEQGTEQNRAISAHRASNERDVSIIEKSNHVLNAFTQLLGFGSYVLDGAIVPFPRGIADEELIRPVLLDLLDALNPLGRGGAEIYDEVLAALVWVKLEHPRYILYALPHGCYRPSNPFCGSRVRCGDAVVNRCAVQN